jgi:hypothetical protein
MRGQISNIGSQTVWIMADVLFDSLGAIRPDRDAWLSRVLFNVDVVVILKPNRSLMDHPHYVAYRTERSLKDAQRSLKQDPRPLCIISESTNSVDAETWSFSENVLSRFNLDMRCR